MPRASIVTVVFAFAAGAAAALALTIWMTPTQVRAGLPVRGGAGPALPESPAPATRADDARIRALEARVVALAAARHAEPEAAATAPEEQPAPNLPSREESARRRREYYRRLQAQFEAEPVEKVWASETQRSLEPELRTLAGASKAEVRALECRSTLCVAAVRWDSYADALGTYEDFLHQAFAVNCAQRILLDPPADPQVAEPYQTNFYIDCAEQGEPL